LPVGWLRPQGLPVNCQTLCTSTILGARIKQQPAFRQQRAPRGLVVHKLKIGEFGGKSKRNIAPQAFSPFLRFKIYALHKKSPGPQRNLGILRRKENDERRQVMISHVVKFPWHCSASMLQRRVRLYIPIRASFCSISEEIFLERKYRQPRQQFAPQKPCIGLPRVPSPLISDCRISGKLIFRCAYWPPVFQLS
jgi:hypothetical protein